MRILKLLFTLSILINITACATNPVTGEQDLVFMSEQDEIRLGEQTHRQIMQQYTPYDDPDLQQYIQLVGAKLAANSHRSHLNYHFMVVDSDDVNAFALPGGWIYITRGIMAYLRSEAELAAVLGHEIGHVTARHGVRQHSATQLANIGLTLGTALLGSYQNVGQQLGSLLGGALLSGYGREHELESDRLGAEYLARSGYDPQAMLDVIGVLKNQETYERKLAEMEGRQPRAYHGLFASHPDNDTRLQQVVGLADRLKTGGSSYEGHDAYLSRIDGLTFGKSTDQGILRGQNFYHAPLGFALRFPADWKVNNLPEAIVATAPDGSAIIQMTLEAIDPGVSHSPRDFIIQKLGVRQLSNESEITIHGLRAHTGTVVVNTAEGSQSPARLVVIYYQNNAYIIVGLSKDPLAMGQYDGIFLDTAKSFHAISEEERLLVKPRRIKLIKADRNTTYDSLAATSPLENLAAEQLRLLNGDYPDGTINSGDTVKIIK